MKTHAIRSQSHQTPIPDIPFRTKRLSPYHDQTIRDPFIPFAMSLLPTPGPAFSNSNGGGLSEGAKAAIGIGVSLGVILAVLALWFLFRYRRKKNAPAEPTDNDREAEFHDPPPSNLPELGLEQQKYELAGEAPWPHPAEEAEKEEIHELSG